MRRLTPIAAALIATGCCFGGGEDSSSSDDEDIPEWMDDEYGDEITPPSDDLFVYAQVTHATGASAPSRLRAPIPATLEGFRHWSATAAPEGPPYNQVQARLRTDDAATIALWLDAATSAARSAPVADVAGAYADLLRYAEGPVVADLRRRVAVTPTPGARETLMLALAFQGQDQDEALFLAADAPPGATLAWLAQHVYPGLTPAQAARLMPALEGHLTTYTPTDDVLAPCGEGVRQALRALEATGRVDDALALASRLTGAHADCFDVELGEVADPRAQERFASACPRVQSPERCAAHRAPEPAPPRGTAAAAHETSILDEVRGYDFEASSVPASGPRHDAVVEALATCASGDDHTALECLMTLADLDRARAVTVARAWITGHRDADPQRAEPARALVAFPDAAALTTYLRTHGLLADDEVAPTSGGVSPLEALIALGRATSFDTETGQYPNQHDTLLIELAALAPTATHGILFEEIVEGTPGGVDLGNGLVADGVVDDEGEIYEGDGPEGDYVLHAFDRDARYTAYAENLGDWYDVDTVVGLLNTIAAQRHVEARWLVLGTGDQTAIVVAGDASGLRHLVQDGWLAPAGRGTSQAARDAEQEILERILREEGGQ